MVLGRPFIAANPAGVTCKPTLRLSIVERCLTTDPEALDDLI